MKKYLLKFVRRDVTAKTNSQSKRVKSKYQQRALPSLKFEISHSPLETACITVLYVTGLVSCCALVIPSAGSIVPTSSKILIPLVVLLASCAAYRDYQRILFTRRNPLNLVLNDNGFIELHEANEPEPVVRKSLHQKTTDYWLMTILVTDGDGQDLRADPARSFSDKRMQARRIAIWRDSVSRTNYRQLRARINLQNEYEKTT